MKILLARALVIVGLALALGGCASYNSQMDRGRNLSKVQRFFVVSNLNDNHGVDHQIAEALKARGREAENGPLTMMPDNTQAVITFQDHWTWDFGEHLVYFQMAARDANSEQSFATVSFSAKIPLREAASVTIARVVDQLLDKSRDRDGCVFVERNLGAERC